MAKSKTIYLLIAITAVAAMFAALVVSGCGTAEDAADKDNGGKQVEEETAPDSITTEVGKAFEVDLMGNPSTGYEWSLAEEPDPKLTKKLWEDTYANDLTPGAPAIQVFKFEALAVGSTDLKFEYSRPWETEAAPEKTQTVTVTIKEGNKEATKEYSDPGTPIDAKKGDDFMIVLESNPSTGYCWELAEELDTTILRLETKRFGNPSPDTREGMVGAPVNEYWRFDTLEAGSTTISFKYVRPWEEDVEPEKTAVFTVNVTE